MRWDGYMMDSIFICGEPDVVTDFIKEEIIAT